ncbi:hypothetical protein GBF38_004801 [Nibea albiflora]|uniref:Uncharacterized protein n=1 Tax=Nibea albiflora TaxID=240163 RepID=A0ACB7EHD6_NIBAL|nr:hypothetical protein GBF38_004801 [Nibea albiflora]
MHQEWRVPAISLNVVALPPKKRKQKRAEGFKVTWRKRDRNGNIISLHVRKNRSVCVLPIPLPLQVCTCGTDQDFTIVPGKQTINGASSLPLTYPPNGELYYQAYFTIIRLSCVVQILMGSICGDTFHRAFREFALCNFKKDDLCQVEPFKCPACTPDMLAISADERPGADSSQEELQREIDDMIYSLRRKKHDLYRQNGMKYYTTQQLMLFFRSFPNISFNLTDSNKTRQRKRRRLTEGKKKLRERIMQYNDDAAFEEKIDTMQHAVSWRISFCLGMCKEMECDPEEEATTGVAVGLLLVLEEGVAPTSSAMRGVTRWDGWDGRYDEHDDDDDGVPVYDRGFDRVSDGNLHTDTLCFAHCVLKPRKPCHATCTVCMKQSTEAAIEAVVEKAKLDVVDLLMNGRALSYRVLQQVIADKNPVQRLKKDILTMAGPKSKARTILETAVTIIRDPESTSYIPRKNVVHLRRTQRPPTEPLREDWSLEPYGMRGSRGYVFKYETGELCLYQLEEGHVRRPSGDAATLSSADWGVLKTVNPKNLAKYEEEFSAVSHAYPREYLARKSTFMAVWLAKTSGTARLFFRASYRVKDYFVLDLF